MKKITYYRGDSERDEARFIVSEMQKQIADKGRKFGDLLFCIGPMLNPG